MKHKAALFRFLKTVMELEFTEFMDIYYDQDITIMQGKDNYWEVIFPQLDGVEEVHTYLQLNEDMDLIRSFCSCGSVRNEDEFVCYCPHVVGAYLAVLEEFNEYDSVIDYVADHTGDIEWLECLDETYNNIFGDGEDSVFGDNSISRAELNELSMYDLFADMDREQILDFLENVNYAFPPLKELLVHAAMLTNMFEDEEEPLIQSRKTKKDMLS
ncbi:MAG: hypothetical protein E7191_05430 [Erysipelotrichaceae bacterium]|nr:hypothetical protein [Erysipelotrichaceae bacterium]MBQ9986793.1 hypothetical protein [Erysipelotrichales bacterium]